MISKGLLMYKLLSKIADITSLGLTVPHLYNEHARPLKQRSSIPFTK